MKLILDTSAKEARVAIKKENLLEIRRWEAGRELSATIFDQIDSVLGTRYSLKDIDGVIVNSGPGSFTGLRIGISIANALAYSLNVPIVGLHEVADFENLVTSGEKELCGQNSFTEAIVPYYGSGPNITEPRKKA